MKKLDETEIIKIFQKTFGNKNFISEDVESFRIGTVNMIVKVDTLVQSTDIPSQMNLTDAARKSVVACISDFAAKGVKPKFGMISINLPKGISKKTIGKISQGFKRASKDFKINILGGDTNQGKEIVFHVCIFGSAGKIIHRKGANVGDLIFVTGPFGYTAAGLEILLKNMRENDNFSRKAKKSVMRPEPRLDFGLKNKDYFTSSMDSSDGLSTTLNEMAKQSKCKFVINNIPCKKDIKEFSKKHKKNLERFVFHGGEEYEIVFTVAKKNKSKIIRNAILSNTPVIEVGQVLKGTGVFIEKNKKLKPLKDLGWRHFKN
ncbi:MAG: thiamine-phosphate kinase [Nitrosopumilus sp.]|nr:thiamine-phosphate kinase [Nitrosopumilus sp.]MDH3385208.1 thiamine-phosphate kinase [Nitrosopumilus sp.]